MPEQFRERELALADDLALHPRLDVAGRALGGCPGWQVEHRRQHQGSVAELDERHEAGLQGTDLVDRAAAPLDVQGVE